MKSAEISIYSTFIGIYLICSSYWVIVFIRRIHCYKVYQKSAYRNILDFNSGYINEQWCHHYETEIWKYIYLIAVNFTDQYWSYANNFLKVIYIERIYIIYLDAKFEIDLFSPYKCSKTFENYPVEFKDC